MTHNDAMKHLVSRYTGKYEGKWGVITSNVLTQEDFDAWECLREHVDVIKEIDAKFDNIDEIDDEDGIVGMI
jgi:hypothetical protein